MSELSKKKPIVYGPDKLVPIFRNVCERGVLARLSIDTFRFNGVFLDADQQGLVLDNRLLHLDDVRRLKDQGLTLYFPFKKTLLKGNVKFIGLTTFKGIRALRFSYPEALETDEKRDVRRIRHLPSSSEIIFHSADYQMFQARIQDASPSGFALIVPEVSLFDEQYFQKGGKFQAEASLDQSLRLSFQIEIRHVTPLPGKTPNTPGGWKLGVKIVRLEQEAQARLNNWLLMCNSREQEMEMEAQNLLRAVAKPVSVSNSILVIGPDSVDLDFWYQCLGRKYEVITSDDNVANIRDSLHAGAALLIVYIDANDPAKASFIRKFCLSLGQRYPIMFFGKETDEKRQQTLMGQVKNFGFLDITERKLLLKFKQVDEVMSQIQG